MLVQGQRLYRPGLWDLRAWGSVVMELRDRVERLVDVVVEG
jgi:hypothetical protein